MEQHVSLTVNKALELLNHFSQSKPEIGLSDMARLAGCDKATTHRLLTTLAVHGLVEQSSTSKLYRLGAGTLRLARMREASFPLSSAVDPILQELSNKTGETVHASLIAGHSLATVGLITSPKAIHVTMGAGDSLPFHATASGISILAYLPDDQSAYILRNNLAAYTKHTLTQSQDVARQVQLARQRGYAVSEQSFEADVIGIASPFFSADAAVQGAMAVATPAHRMTRDVKSATIRAVCEAALAVTHKFGAEPPPQFAASLRRLAA
jgi:IclR family transcriptional regulator, acetate operon repressor